MNHNINRFSSGFCPDPRTEYTPNAYTNDKDFFDPKLAYNDHGKSYFVNLEIYSNYPYFDPEEWLRACGV